MRRQGRLRVWVGRLGSALSLVLTVAEVTVTLLSETHVSTIGDASFLHGFVPEATTTRIATNAAAAVDGGGMAACLLVRDDNALIPEWIAHHYTVLPLRALVIAADLGSTQDIQWISQTWSPLLQQQQQQQQLRISIWNHTHFLHRFPAMDPNETDNHQYLHRQRAFLTSCMEFFKGQNKTWVALVDTDEYITLNRDYEHYTGQDQTVLDALKRHSPTSPCHGMPRLLFGALENRTCQESEHVRNMMKEHSFPPLTTIRFVQHATKGAFYPSKWGKVLVNVNDVSWESLQHKPKSSHRPLKECAKPLFDWNGSPISVNHYFGSWERYSRRKDGRRSREAFEERAFLDDGNNCNAQMHEWLPRFVRQVGLDRARELLLVVHDE
jgi:hypothetical protein